MTDLPTYHLDRTFDAPLPLVWRAWTDPELLSRWYGPGVETVIHAYDLKPGGAWLNEMRMGEKSDFSKMAFQEVVEGEKLVWLHSSTDADWNVAANQMMPGWPKTLLATVTFTAAGEKTDVRLSMVPVDPTEEEASTFAAAMEKMGFGWGAGYRVIDEILAELQA